MTISEVSRIWELPIFISVHKRLSRTRITVIWRSVFFGIASSRHVRDCIIRIVVVVWVVFTFRRFVVLILFFGGFLVQVYCWRNNAAEIFLGFSVATTARFLYQLLYDSPHVFQTVKFRDTLLDSCRGQITCTLLLEVFRAFLERFLQY